jgi:hypothetical protein
LNATALWRSPTRSNVGLRVATARSDRVAIEPAAPLGASRMRAIDSLRRVFLVGLPTAYQRVALAGWFLYAVSWITPASDGHHFGATVFLDSVGFAFSSLSAGTARGTLIGLCLIFGWLANLSILLRLPVGSRAAWIAAPWFPFVISLVLLPTRPTIPERAAYILFFYPWAIGIALIHVAHIAASRTSGSPRGSWPTGPC